MNIEPTKFLKLLSSKTIALVFVCWSVLPHVATVAEAQSSGAELYEKHCAQCHGENGDAKTPAAGYYKPAPRDFTSGKYKVRSTGSGELPTDQDIKNAIQKGLAFSFKHGAYTVMPPWPNFSDAQLDSLVAHLKTFSSDFADPEYNNPKVIEIPSPVASSEESVKRGRTVFENNECIKCHGEQGRADGPSAPTLTDDWGFTIRAANLTKPWTFRGGSSPEDVFRTVTTGFNGTPMPAYGESLSVEDRWDLVNYLQSLSKRTEPNYNKPDKPIAAKPIQEEVNLDDFEKALELFAAASPAFIPIAGQVVEPGRNPYPSTDEVVVKAVYNEDEIAILLTWHDMKAETSGTNGPDLDAPAFTPEMGKSADSGEEDDDDPFGEESGDEEEEDDPFADEEGGEESESSDSAGQSQFSDAIAVQFPNKMEEGFKKPYFVFGDSKRPVDLWFYDLASDSPKRYLGKGSSSVTEKESASLAGASQFQDGEWNVILKRKRNEEGQISFAERTMIPLGLSVWDGFSEDRGNKRGLTSWFNLYVEPMTRPNIVIPMMLYGGGLFFLQLLIIWLVRRNENN